MRKLYIPLIHIFDTHFLHCVLIQHPVFIETKLLWGSASQQPSNWDLHVCWPLFIFVFPHQPCVMTFSRPAGKGKGLLVSHRSPSACPSPPLPTLWSAAANKRQGHTGWHSFRVALKVAEIPRSSSEFSQRETSACVFMMGRYKSCSIAYNYNIIHH